MESARLAASFDVNLGVSEAEERLGLAMQIGRMYAFEWNPETDVVLRAGDADLIESLWGTAQDTGDHFLSRVHPEDREPFHTVACELSEERPTYQISYRFIHDNGSVIWLHERGQAFYDTSGKLLRVVGVTADITKTKETEESLRLMGGLLLSAQEEERQKIARELHDDIGQDLAILNVRTQRLALGCENEKLQNQIKELQSSTQQIGTKVRRLSHQLHASELDYIGLPTALQMLCRDFSQNSSLEVECACIDVPTPLNRDLSIALYRVTQEALNNVVKHAGATSARVDLSTGDEHLVLRVTDNGRGFQPDTHKRSGLGLISMRERINLVGGSLTLSSRPDAGTTIEVRVPYRVAPL